jgi:hypothetical protein
MSKLAILCPTLKHGAIVKHNGNIRIGNGDLLKRMCDAIAIQVEATDSHEVKMFLNVDSGEKTTGTKRNELVADALAWGADAHAFHDDDDIPGPTYIKRGLEFLESGMDVAELWGQIYFNGKAGNPFHHSIIHKEWWQDDKFYYRMPNHLNFVRTALVKDINFPDQVFGEDGKQSYAMRDAGVLKTEFKIPEIIYHYYCGEPKHAL